MNVDENSLLAQAQQLARHEQGAKDEQERQVFQSRVDQIASFIADYGPGCSRALALMLGRSPEEPLFADRVWELSKTGETKIDFDDQNRLLVDSRIMPQLVTNLESYAVGVHHFYELGDYSFGLTSGGESWTSFTDLTQFGRLTLTAGNASSWDKTELTQYRQPTT